MTFRFVWRDFLPSKIYYKNGYTSDRLSRTTLFVKRITTPAALFYGLLKVWRVIT